MTKRQSNDTTGSLELDVDSTGGGPGGGDASAANQVTQIAQLAAILAEEATEAKQDVGNASLASIDSKLINPLPVSGTVTVIATNLDIRDLAFATDKVDVSGSSSVGVTGPLTDTQLRATPVPVSGTVTATVPNPLPISAAALPLPSGASTSALQTQPGVDIGDVTVNNASGASAVNIQDGGNTITVDGTITANAGTNLNTSALALDASVTVLGTTSGAAVITDANGTIQQYLRGLIKLAITAGSFLVTATLAAGSALIGYVGRKFTYGSPTTLTTTNFLSLTNTSGWQSDSITTNGSSEIQFNLTTLGAAGSTALVDFYLAEAFTSGNFTDAATGTEGTFTAANRKNSRYLGSLQLNTTSSVTGCMKYTDVSGSLCEKVSLIAINNSGGTISGTGGNTVFKYELIN